MTGPSDGVFNPPLRGEYPSFDLVELHRAVMNSPLHSLASTTCKIGQIQSVVAIHSAKHFGQFFMGTTVVKSRGIHRLGRKAIII